MKSTRRQVIQSLAGNGLILPNLLTDVFGNTRLRRSVHSKANRVIFLFMSGGVSHVDTFDHKPYLMKHHHKSRDRDLYFKGSAWKFRRHGQCGMEMSELFPHLGGIADDICMIRSMRNTSDDHNEATIAVDVGSALPHHNPRLGVSYGLGSVNENLPSFVLMAKCQKRALRRGRSGELCVHDESGSQAKTTRRTLPAFLDGADRVDRIRSSESLAGLQLNATDAFDLARESKATLRMYGVASKHTASFARQCVVARRLAERGAQFIEVVHGDFAHDGSWDAHSNLSRYGRLSKCVDRPVAALINDLKLRGMYDDTLVVWTTEFGRSPFVYSPETDGRGHHANAYCSFLGGAGIKRGFVHGSSDELGNDVATETVSTRDLQTTILHLLGRTPGSTSQDSGRVVRQILE